MNTQIDTSIAIESVYLNTTTLMDTSQNDTSMDYRIGDNETTRAVAITICCIGWILCVPMTYWFIQFYRQRNNVMIHKRYAFCTLILYIIIMIDTIIERPSFLLLQVGVLDNNKLALQVTLWITIGVYSFVFIGFSACILWRFYLLFYDINYSKQSQNGQWKELIAPQHNNSNNSNNSTITKSKLKHQSHQWFLTHVHTRGNFKWVTIRMSVVTFVLVAISYIMWIYGYYVIIDDPNNMSLYNILVAAQTYDFMVNMVMLIILIILYCHIPLFYDHFYVREELRLVFICAIMYYISVIIFFCMLIALKDVHLASLIFTLIYGLFATLAQFMIIYIQTAWVLHKISPYLNIQQRLLHKRKSQVVMGDLNKAARSLDEEAHTELAIRNNREARTSDKPYPGPASLDEYAKMKLVYTVHDVLEHSVGFDAFMSHLIKEFSMECLLSYVEFTQFLDFIYMKWIDVGDVEKLYLPQLPSSVPYSHIISQNEVMTSVEVTYGKDDNKVRKKHSKTLSAIKKSVKKKISTSKGSSNVMDLDKMSDEHTLKVSFEILSIANAFHYKYVRQGSDLEINISGPLRKQFVDTFEQNEWKKDGDKTKVDVTKILSLYTKATSEMHKLLNFSFDRFREKHDFQRLMKRCLSDVDRSQKSKDTVWSGTDDRESAHLP